MPDYPIPTFLELERMNVHSLRKFARRLQNFPIAGREISMAVRPELMQMLKSHLERLDTNVRRSQRELPNYSETLNR